MLSDNEAAFIGFILEGISWGVNLVIFILSLTFLIWRRSTKRINVRMLVATVVLFSLCTTHYALEVENTVTSFFDNPDNIPLSQETPVLVGADTLLSITDFCANLVLIYRLWIVWSKTWYIVVLPLVMAFSAVSCYMAAIGLLVDTDPTAPLAPAAIQPLITGSLSMSLILNILVTFLILGRMWYISRAPREALGSKRAGPPRVYSAMGVLIESGLLFMVAQIVFVTLFALGSPAQDVVMPITLQIYGIAPIMIIVRVGMGVSSDPTSLIASSAHQLSRLSRKPPGMTISVTTDQVQSHDVEFEYRTPYTKSPSSPRASSYISPTSYGKPELNYPWTNDSAGHAV